MLSDVEMTYQLAKFFIGVGFLLTMGVFIANLCLALILDFIKMLYHERE